MKQKAVYKFTIIIAQDYSKTPGPRYIVEGENSGELFRKKVLLPKFSEALKEKQILFVDLDGTAGYGPSFLEEAFGGLIREDGFSNDVVLKNITIKSDEEPDILDSLKEYISEATNEK
jgi:hypothetical protein